MDLKIKDVAKLLNVSETTIRRWLAEEKIPAYRISHEYRFSRIEIEDWVMKHKLGQADGTSPFEKEKDGKERVSAKGGTQQYGLYRALHKGTVLKNAAGKNKQEIISTTTDAMAQGLNLDSTVLCELLMDREKLQPTALNNGIAVPHTRDFLLNKHHDVVTIVFPEEPIDYGSLDGNPVHTLFFLFACDDKRHLHLLAKIAHLSSQPETLKFLKTKPSKEELLEYVKEWEGSIPHK